MGKKKASRTAGDVTSGKARATGWCRSKCTDSDLRKLCKFGLLSATTEAKLAGDEAVPRPDNGWRDEKVREQKFGFTPFDPTKEVKKLKSWDQMLTETELEETKPLMARIHALQTDKGKELSGLQIMTHFLRLQVQPIQARVSALWTYSGSKDPTRVSKENLSTSELEKLVRQFTRLTQKDDIPSSCRVVPFDKKHPPPAGHDHLNCPPPRFLRGVRDEDESPNSPAAGRAKTLEAPASTPMKPMSSREQTADSTIPKDPAAGPKAPPKKKSKKGDANKGIKIAKNPTVPSMDDPIMREMVDMATHCIGFRDKASSLEVALQNSEEIQEDAMKSAEALEAKFKAAEKALEEVQARAKSEEERWEEVNARMATREAEICQRLNTLSTSLTKITDYSLQLGKDHEVDPLLDSLSILEGNSVRARNLLTRSCRAFKHLHGHVFPKEKVPEDFDELVGLFNGEPDPMLEHHRATTKTGSETTIDNSPNPTSSSDPSGQDKMTKESNTPKNSNVITRTIDPPLYTEKVRRIKELGDKIKKVKGQVIVSLSKAKWAAEREDFILEEISRASETMKCIHLSDVDEAKRLRNWMNALYEASSGTANDFWTDNKRSHVLALPQDRVSEVGEFVKCCCSAMALIYNSMFPRNPQPQGLAALMKAFMNGEAIHKFVRVQLVAGAKVAFS
ncbi:hypothetical protein ACQ4PT_018060 [Festuca glaucescens]